MASKKVTLTASETSVDEGAGSTTVTVTGTLDGASRTSETAVELMVGATDDAAVEGTDYTAVSDFKLTIAAGMTSGMATFTLTPTDDDVDEHDETFSVVGSATAAELPVTGTRITIKDNDERGVAVSSATLTVPEGGDATYTVVLGSQPTGPVTVMPSVGGDPDVTVSPSALTFTTTNWSTVQTVTVSAPQDADADDDAATVSHAVSGADYGSVEAASVAVRVTDDETASTGVALSVSPSTVGEAAGATTVTVTGTLDHAPLAAATNVTVSVTAGTASVGDFGPVRDVTLTIAAAQTSGTATFTLTPVADAVDEDDETLTVGGSAEGLTVTPATVTIADNDERGVAVSSATLTVPEGGDATYTVVLGSQPTGPVTVMPSVGGDDPDVTVSPSALTFTTTNWSTVQTVTVSAPQDADADDDAATVSHAVSGADYGSVEAATVAVRVTDDETTSATVTLTASQMSVDEGAGSTTVTVTGTLDGAPRTSATSVTVSVGTSADSATEGTDYGTIADFALTIAAGQNTGTATFTFTPSNDEVDEDDEAVSLSGTTDVAGLSVAGTTLRIDDDDTRGVEVSLSTLSVVEDQSGTYSVRLNSRPDEDVTVTPRSDNPHVKFDPASLVFDTDGWDTPQQISFMIKDENQHDLLTIRHTVNGYGNVTDGGVVTVRITQSPVAQERQTVHRTVAAVAAATVSNVTSNIGARFSAPTGGATVNLAGTRVAFAPTNSKLSGTASLSDPFDVRGRGTGQTQHRTMTGSDLLRSSSFEIALGASQGDKDPPMDASNRLTVWGRGDFQLFESGGGRKSGYEGDLFAGYLGIDFAMDGGWLAGLAISKIAAEADYTLGRAGGGGTLEAKLTNVHPYFRFAVGERTEAWAIFGQGAGEVTNATEQSRSKNDMWMRMASAGGRHGLATVGGIDLTILADGSFAIVETDDGVQAIDGISADVWRARIGGEASYTMVWDGGSALTSFLEVAGRKDGGDSARGVGLEISPGLAFNHPESGLAMEARGRVLALHSADNHREYGASITVSKAPGEGGLGLSMAIIPTWGTPDNSLNAAGARLFPTEAADRHSDSLSLNSRLAYGFAAGKGVLAPFVDFSLRDNDGRRIRIGSRYSLGPSVELELSGDRDEGASGSFEHSVRFSGGIRF